MEILLYPNFTSLRAGLLRTPLLTAAICAYALLEPSRSLASPRIVAVTADDVCAPDANPCVIDSVIVVRDGTILDFGTRTLSLEGKGQFRLHGDDIEIRCGDFLSATAGRVALRSRKGETTKSLATIVARRTCSGEPIPCVRDADCTLGTCSIGDGRIEINGNIRFAFVYDAKIALLASGDVLVRGDARSGGCPFPWLDVYSELGSVTSEGDVRFRGAEPYLSYSAFGSVRVSGRSEVRGYGVFDAISDQGDVMLSGEIDVSAAQGGGDGGEIFLHAESGEIRIDGGTADFPQRILANGSRGRWSEGDGAAGFIDSFSEGRTTVGPHVEIEVRTSSALGYGGYVYFEGSEFVLAGTIDASGDLPVTEIFAEGDLTLTSTSSISMRSAPGAASGELTAYSTRGNLRMEGQVSIEGGFAYSNGYANVDLGGCDVVFAGGSTTSATPELADVFVLAHESLSVEGGASVQGGMGGTEFRYRSGGPMPIIDGLVTPSPLLVPDATLLPCSP